MNGLELGWPAGTALIVAGLLLLLLGATAVLVPWSAHRFRTGQSMGVGRPAHPIVRIEHVALWTRDVDALVAFYVTRFGATAGPPYRNPRSGLHSVFLSWPASGARLEVMARPDVIESIRPSVLGYAHFALAVADPGAVDRWAADLGAEGVPVAGAPRWTGDGYYEAVLLDPAGNQIELVADPATHPPHRRVPAGPSSGAA